MKKKIIILVAGYPGTGKSYLCGKLRLLYPEFRMLSPDEIKEKLWDCFGFESLDEKKVLEQRAWDIYYQEMDERMQAEEYILSDYPFSDKQKNRISDIAERNGYIIITIRLIGDIDILYLRSEARDLNPTRHLGHLMSHYKKGDMLEDRTKADLFVTKEIFRERCMTRGYEIFQLGALIEVDVTSMDNELYARVFQKIRNLMS